MATIRDVAEHAQVSVGTVSRVINDHPSVSPAIRRVVLAAIDELRYQPNSIARTLRTSRTRALGLVMSGLGSTMGLAGAEVVAQEYGYALFVADSRFDPEVEARNIRGLIERRVDGLLCNPVESSRIIHDLVRGSNVPTVVWGWTVANRVLPTVVLRETAAIAAGVDHLVDLGHQQVGVIALDGPTGTGSAIRRRVIHEAFQTRGVVTDGEFDRCVSPPACTAAVRELLTGRRRPTAMMVTASQLTPPLLAGIRAAGARIPDDVSLICFDGSEWASVFDPPLNAIALDLFMHAGAATRLLIGMAQHQPGLPRTIEHRSQYIRRGSVARAPVYAPALS